MKTASEIYAEMKAAVEEGAGVTLSDTGDMGLRLRCCAEQIGALWAEAAFVSRQSFPQTASGTYLDHHAQIRGLTRTAAVKSAGAVRFYIDRASASDITVSAGTLCMTAAETYFETTADAVITAGSLYCDADARAVAAGATGNAPALSVCRLPQPPAGVTRCSNLSAFTGGADAESDERLRARVLGSYQALPNGANKAYYEQQALSVPGVAAVTVLPKNRGAGTVDIYISGTAGLPSNELVAAVQTKLDAQREICVDIDVAAPSAVSVDITAEIAAASGYTFSGVKTAVEAALAAYFNGRRLGESVLLAKLGDIIYSVPGVHNYSLSSPAADTEITSAQLPAAGTITITEMS